MAVSGGRKMARRCKIFRILRIFFILTLITLKGTLNGSRVSPLVLYSNGDLPYAVAIVKRVGDDLSLSCQLQATHRQSPFIWTFLPDHKNFSRLVNIDNTNGMSMVSNITRYNLNIMDSGVYLCSIPPHSAKKLVLVQPRVPGCARGGFTCGNLCVLGSFLCDGYKDCENGDDEDPSLCGEVPPCHESKGLNCTSGRCIPKTACCVGQLNECHPHPCCDDHPKYLKAEYVLNIGYPTKTKNKHTPEDYEFLSTTVVVISVAVLIMVLCRMRLKRAQTYAPPAPCVYQDRFEAAQQSDDVQPYHSVPLQDDENPRMYARRPPAFQVGRFQLSLSGAQRAGPRSDTSNVGDIEMQTISRSHQGHNGHDIPISIVDEEPPPSYEEAMSASGAPPPTFLSQPDPYEGPSTSAI